MTFSPFGKIVIVSIISEQPSLVQRIGNWQLVAGCRFSCRFKKKKHVQRIGNWQLVAGCRFRFETDNISSRNWKLATSCRFSIQIRKRKYNSNESAISNQFPVADSVADSKQSTSTNAFLPIQLPIRYRQV